MDEQRHEAFRQLKSALTSAPILGFPREDRLWYIDTDASDVGTGAVLSQIQDEEERSLPMSASRWKEASRGTARPARSCGGGSGPEALQMLFIRAKDSQDGQQRRELAA